MFGKVVRDDVFGDFAGVGAGLFHGFAFRETIRNPRKFDGVAAAFFRVDDVFDFEFHS